MNTRSRISLYLIALSYVITELIKVWESNYAGGRFPMYLVIPLIPISIGLLIALITVSEEEK